MQPSAAIICACPACGSALRLALGAAGLCPHCAEPLRRPAHGGPPATIASMPMRSLASTPAAAAQGAAWGAQRDLYRAGPPHGLADSPVPQHPLLPPRQQGFWVHVPWAGLALLGGIIALLLMFALSRWHAQVPPKPPDPPPAQAAQRQQEAPANVAPLPAEGAEATAAADPAAPAAAGPHTSSSVPAATAPAHAAAPVVAGFADAAALARARESQARRWQEQSPAPSEISWSWIWPRLLVVWVVVVLALIFGWMLKN